MGSMTEKYEYFECILKTAKQTAFFSFINRYNKIWNWNLKPEKNVQLFTIQ